jgi:hypothetical protein
MTGAIESREASTIRVGAEVTRTIKDDLTHKDVTHVGRVTDSRGLVGLGHQIVIWCTECREAHYWTLSPKTLITTRTER